VDSELKQRLQRSEDILSIQQLFNQYASHLDAGRFDRYAALFSVNGEVKLGPLGRAKGRAEIEALMRKNLAASVGQSYHIISNPVIQLDGDSATSEVMWTVILRGDGDRPVLGMIGRHRDELVRENGEWCFLSRAGFVDIPSAMKGDS
jgi:hypothetical protein